MLQPFMTDGLTTGNGDRCILLQWDASGDDMPEILQKYIGKVQCVYIDPPFMSGGKYLRRRPVGEDGWRNGKPQVELTAYDDVFNEREYYDFLVLLVKTAHMLLSDIGLIYLHLDWHGDYMGRIALNQVFGADNFVDEIIWAYSTGGRSRRYFSRKHDTILMARKGAAFPFDITKIPLENSQDGKKRNHMRLVTDENGKLWRTITSAGKLYRYAADEPEYPTDVWCDISHLQQRDPERTGFLTQKPSRLMDRLLLPVLNKDDIFCDLTCGSGSSLVAARRIGAVAIGTDLSEGALAVSAHRLNDGDCTLISQSHLQALPLSAPAELNAYIEGNTLHLLNFDDGSGTFHGLDGIESYHLCQMQANMLHSLSYCGRTRRNPVLDDSPVLPHGCDAIDIVTPMGQRFSFNLKLLQR